MLRPFAGDSHSRYSRGPNIPQQTPDAEDPEHSNSILEKYLTGFAGLAMRHLGIRSSPWARAEAASRRSFLSSGRLACCRRPAKADLASLAFCSKMCPKKNWAGSWASLPDPAPRAGA